MNASTLADRFTVDAQLLRGASAEEWKDRVARIYQEHGIVLLSRLIPKSEIWRMQSDIAFVIELAVRKLRVAGKILPSGELANSDRFDKGMLDVCAQDRSVAGEVFRVAKKLLSVQRLTTSPTFEQLSQALIGTERVAVHPAGTNVRADHPGEDHYLYPWHQDYLYNLGSKDSVTFWSPLVDVDDENGCLLIALGSHRSGIFPVHVNDALNHKKNSAQSFRIANIDRILAQFPIMSLPMRCGDVVVFHGNFLHSSQRNRSKGTRWSAQFRYFNLEAPDAVEHGWPGGMAEGFDFTKYHPEAVAT